MKALQSKPHRCHRAETPHVVYPAYSSPARPRGSPALHALDDLAAVYLQLPDALTALPPFSNAPYPLLPAVAVAVAVAAAAAAAAATADGAWGRARAHRGACVSGWSRGDLVEVRPSSVHGRGVVAREDIAAGTAIGAYPGVLRSAADVQSKARRAPGCRNFVFCVDGDRYLDPTDAHGHVSLFPGPSAFAWPSAIDPTMTFVNEPPVRSGGPNLTVVDGASATEMLFVTSRQVLQGEELFVDYGTAYDRSSYASKPQL